MNDRPRPRPIVPRRAAPASGRQRVTLWLAAYVDSGVRRWTAASGQTQAGAATGGGGCRRGPGRRVERGRAPWQKGKRRAWMEAVGEHLKEKGVRGTNVAPRLPSRYDRGAGTNRRGERGASRPREHHGSATSSSPHELAAILKVPATQIVGFAFKNLGLMVTINQRLDFGQIELIAGEFGFQAVLEAEYAADMGVETIADTEEQLITRPPVVTIMGHVDQQDTLLDYIRRRSGVLRRGIKRHRCVPSAAGAQITFLDTPGPRLHRHAARGAQVPTRHPRGGATTR